MIQNRNTFLINEYKNNPNQQIFLTGAAGTGKSSLIKSFKETFIKEFPKKNFFITASTGKAANEIGGVTVHNFFQINPNKIYKYFDYKWTNAFKKTGERIRKTDVLIIDEISMIDDVVLNLINKILKYHLNSTKPFGGLFIVFVGDFLQLPPIENEWCFNARSWIDANIKTIELKGSFRQKDKNFNKILNNVRTGLSDLTQEEKTNIIKQFKIGEPKNPEDYIKLVSRNNEALIENKNHLNSNTNEPYFFKWIVSYKRKTIKEETEDSDKKIEEENKARIMNELKKFMKQIPIEEELILKHGVRVIATRNDNIKNEYYNGSLGVVEVVENGYIKVKWDSGETTIFDKEDSGSMLNCNWKYNTLEGKTLLNVVQYPLKLAYALTIHKSQGMTIDKIYIKTNNFFAAGQAYVALSRATNLENLYVKHLSIWDIKADPEALEFYKSLKNHIIFNAKDDRSDFVEIDVLDSSLLNDYSKVEKNEELLKKLKERELESFVPNNENTSEVEDKYIQKLKQELSKKNNNWDPQKFNKSEEETKEKEEDNFESESFSSEKDLNNPKVVRIQNEDEYNKFLQINEGQENFQTDVKNEEETLEKNVINKNSDVSHLNKNTNISNSNDLEEIKNELKSINDKIDKLILIVGIKNYMRMDIPNLINSPNSPFKNAEEALDNAIMLLTKIVEANININNIGMSKNKKNKNNNKLKIEIAYLLKQGKKYNEITEKTGANQILINRVEHEMKKTGQLNKKD